jgi:hypothetical protein
LATSYCCDTITCIHNIWCLPTTAFHQHIRCQYNTWLY